MGIFRPAWRTKNEKKSGDAIYSLEKIKGKRFNKSRAELSFLFEYNVWCQQNTAQRRHRI